MKHALALDSVLKGERRLQGRALTRHFPEHADIPSSHSEPSEVSVAYSHSMEFSDPDLAGPFTGAELGLLLKSRLLPPRVPRVDLRDLAFVGGDTVGLSWPGGRWREPRIWNLLHTAGIARLFARGDVPTLLRARATAWASLNALARTLLGRGSDHAH